MASDLFVGVKGTTPLELEVGVKRWGSRGGEGRIFKRLFRVPMTKLNLFQIQRA